MAETDLFRGERYRVRHWRTDATPRTVVSFTTWLAKPGLDEDFSGAGFFIHRGINLIGIQSTDNDWFQHGEIARALAAVREATPGHQRIGYGGSMGGYAVINFADALDLHSLVAICPQVSVDPARAPFEDRWLSEARRITFDNDRIETAPPLAKGFIVYDPWGKDGQHAARILAHHQLTAVRIRFVGHALLLGLQQMGLLTPLLERLIADSYDPADFQRELRAARRNSSVAWMMLSEVMRERGNTVASLRAAETARSMPEPAPKFEIDLAYAHALMANGARAAAGEAVAPYLDDPAFKDAMPWVLHKLGLTEAELRMPPEPCVEAVPPDAAGPWWRRLLRRA